MTIEKPVTHNPHPISDFQFPEPVSTMILQDLVNPYHPNYEAQNQSGAYEDNQIGCKEGHDKGIGVFQFIASDQDKDSKDQEKATCKDEDNLAQPPENAVHEKNPGSGVMSGSGQGGEHQVFTGCIGIYLPFYNRFHCPVKFT